MDPAGARAEQLATSSPRLQVDNERPLPPIPDPNLDKTVGVEPSSTISNEPPGSLNRGAASEAENEAEEVAGEAGAGVHDEDTRKTQHNLTLGLGRPADETLLLSQGGVFIPRGDTNLSLHTSSPASSHQTATGADTGSALTMSRTKARRDSLEPMDLSGVNTGSRIVTGESSSQTSYTNEARSSFRLDTSSLHMSAQTLPHRPAATRDGNSDSLLDSSLLPRTSSSQSRQGQADETPPDSGSPIVSGIRPQTNVQPSPGGVLSTMSQQREHATGLVLPRWQPDAEVTFCPICRTQFSFFIRKHHCRKCGRVVCAQCSPHRITIPHQYIVHPPNAEGFPPSVRPALPTIDQSRVNSSLGVVTLGGERVRLCNPCVPDPNIAPPQSLQLVDSNRQFLRNSNNTHARSASTTSASLSTLLSVENPSHESLDPTSTFSRYHNRGPGSSSIMDNDQSSSSNIPARGPAYRWRGSRASRPEGSDSRSRSSTVGNPNGNFETASRTGDQSQSNISSGLSTYQAQRFGSISSRRDQRDRELIRQRLSNPTSQPTIPEEDECWICHRELPSRDLPYFEILRSEHVEYCIAREMRLNLPSISQPVPTPPLSESTGPVQGVISSESVSRASSSNPVPIARTPEARMAAREQAHAAVVFGSSGSPGPSQARRTGLISYTATEKDCVDSAECTICLEEYEVGVPMGRLECFCRFHIRCIRAWFVGHPGQCPVHHQPGDN